MTDSRILKRLAASSLLRCTLSCTRPVIQHPLRLSGVERVRCQYVSGVRPFAAAGRYSIPVRSRWRESGRRSSRVRPCSPLPKKVADTVRQARRRSPRRLAAASRHSGPRQSIRSDVLDVLSGDAQHRVLRRSRRQSGRRRVETVTVRQERGKAAGVMQSDVDVAFPVDIPLDRRDAEQGSRGCHQLGEARDQLQKTSGLTVPVHDRSSGPLPCPRILRARRTH